jgi:hypothetical protein
MMMQQATAYVSASSRPPAPPSALRVTHESGAHVVVMLAREPSTFARQVRRGTLVGGTCMGCTSAILT